LRKITEFSIGSINALVLVFNHRSDCPTNIELGEHVIKAQDTLTYLGELNRSNLLYFIFMMDNKFMHTYIDIK
jgi:hypothetical protein